MAAIRFAGAPMSTNENRSLYDRSTLRYPSDLTDEEWDILEKRLYAFGLAGDICQAPAFSLRVIGA